jgi:hypothetical protein
MAYIYYALMLLVFKNGEQAMVISPANSSRLCAMMQVWSAEVLSLVVTNLLLK